MRWGTTTTWASCCSCTGSRARCPSAGPHPRCARGGGVVAAGVQGMHLCPGNGSVSGAHARDGLTGAVRLHVSVPLATPPHRHTATPPHRQDEVITPPIPYAWSMWYMGYGPGDRLQTTLQVAPLNVSYFLQTAAPGQLCPLAAWSAYWTLRTHGIPTHRCGAVSVWHPTASCLLRQGAVTDRRNGTHTHTHIHTRPCPVDTLLATAASAHAAAAVCRNLTLEGLCSGMLDAQYGAAAASIIRSRLMEHPLRLVINKHWESKVDGELLSARAPAARGTCSSHARRGRGRPGPTRCPVPRCGPRLQVAGRRPRRRFWLCRST
jgi:hypothetical protein